MTRPRGRAGRCASADTMAALDRSLDDALNQTGALDNDPIKSNRIIV